MASKVHKVRFYSPEPQAINCVSLNKTKSWVALARADASIEIWDVKKSPHMIIFIPGTDGGSVEALGWVHERLMSTGLTGALIEWDLDRQCPKTTVLLTGSAAWCLDVNSANTLVAVGTEQGFLNLYSVEDGEIVYKKLFDKQEGRIISCNFNKAGNMLVTGSINTIRTWNVETGHATNKLTVSHRGRKQLLVWSVLLMSDNVIVSGDSNGRLIFWDGTLGEQIETFTTHKADILSVTISDDEKEIYCAGIDPIISSFVKVDRGKGTNETQWVKNVQRNIHEHDVRALVLHEKTLISAGVDGYLTFSSYPPKWVLRIPPMVPMPRSFVCPTKKLLMLRYKNHLEVWKLGSYVNNIEDNFSKDVEDVDDFTKDEDYFDQKKEAQIEPDSVVPILNGHKDSERLSLTSQPLKFVTIKTKKSKQIQCCDMSPSGEFVVYATDSDTRLLKLETDEIDEEQTHVSACKLHISGVSSPAQRVSFAADSRTMVVQSGAELLVLRVDPDAGATVVQALHIDKHLKSKPIIHMLVTKPMPSGSYVAVCDAAGAVVIFAERNKKLSHHVTLPASQCLPTAMAEDAGRETLIIAYSDLSVLEYDLRNKRFTGWPGALPREWFARRPAVAAVALHSARDAVIFAGPTAMWVIDRGHQEVKELQSAAKRRPYEQNASAIKALPMKYLSGFHWLSPEEAVLIETLPEHIVSQLPAPARLNRWHARPDRL